MTDRKEFEKLQLFNVLKRLSEKLEKEIQGYLIGGLAMIFYGTKLATKDVDVVFDSYENTQVFVKAMKNIGFFEVKNLTGEYLNLEAHQVLESDDGCRFDIFMNKGYYRNSNRGYWDVEELCDIKTFSYKSIFIQARNP